MKAHLRLTIADDDAYLTALITAARRAIESRYGLALITQSWALFADRWPERNLFHLPLWPVIAVDSLTSFADDDMPTLIDPSAYMLDAGSRPARVALRHGHLFPQPGRRINGLKLSFTAGFGADASTLPQDIKEGLMAVVADWYQNRGDASGGALPATALAALAPYHNARLS